MKFYESSREKDKQEAWIIVRYLLFYMAFIFVLAFSTNLLDQIFYCLGYGTIYQLPNPVFQYIGKYLFYGFIAFPLSFAYNWVINQLMGQTIWVRFALGISFSLIVGASIALDYKFGHYRGEYRQLKNLLAMVLSGVLIELLRSLVVFIRIRMKK